MGQYVALANFYIAADRVAKRGELLELGDAAALNLMRLARVEPADEATRLRYRQEPCATWGPPPEPTAAAPGSWLNWR